jgi:hypothetical protein
LFLKKSSNGHHCGFKENTGFSTEFTGVIVTAVLSIQKSKHYRSISLSVFFLHPPQRLYNHFLKSKRSCVHEIHCNEKFVVE